MQVKNMCREGYYGVYKVAHGPHQGSLVYYDDDAPVRSCYQAICYFQGSDRYAKIPYRDLVPADKIDDQLYRKTATKVVQKLMRCDAQEYE